MKKRIVIICFLFLVPFLVLSQTGYTELNDPEFEFSIMLPPGFSDAETSSAEIDTAMGIKVQKNYVSSSDHAIIIISALNLGFIPESEERMAEGQEYARMEYTYSFDVIDEGQTRIQDRLFLTGRYTFNQDGTDLYFDLFISHIGNFQYEVQVLADNIERLDQEDLSKAVNSFTYTGSH